MEHANLEEYADPLLYDAENPSFEPQGPFYLALAQRLGGPVLELGCGTGRLAIPLARHGVEMTGLDVHPGMLARARLKAAELPIRWIEADARHFQMTTRFNLIVAAAGVFQHFLERADLEAMLARVRAHLAPGGCFAFDLYLPQTRVDEETEREWFSYTASDGREVQVSGVVRYDPLRQLQLETARRRWRDVAGREVDFTAPLVLRYFFPEETEALLDANGFTVLDRYGDWDASPPAAESPTTIYVCR
jgi:SAM-dependent methyltransferase